jgi:hypothetical protein
VDVNRERFSRWWTLVAMAVLLLTAQGCTSRSSKRTQEDKTNRSTRTNNPLERQLDGGSYCVQTITQGPPVSTPIHFSNKENESDGSAKDFEADLSGDTFDLTIHERHPATDLDRQLNDVPGGTPISIHDGFAENTRTNHYTRADAPGWRVGANSVVLGATPWGLFVNKPIVTRVGTESINGYETIKYAVDTTHQSQLDKSPLLIAGGLKDYNITGTAWAAQDTDCILQYVIDFEKDGKDGTVSKIHYQGGITKP